MSVDAERPLPEITEPTSLDAVTQPDPQDTVTVPTVAGPVEVARPTRPRDGTIKGEPVYTDGHCPLLVDEADVDNRTIVEEHTNQDGTPAGQTVHRYSKVVLTDPTECPTCHKFMERHGLVAVPVTGTRDCAIAIQARGNPEYTKLFGANSAPLADQQAEASKHGLFGKRWLKVFGEKPNPDDMPALDYANIQDQERGIVDTQERSPESKAHEKWLAEGKPEVSADEWAQRVEAEKPRDGEAPPAVGTAQGTQTAPGYRIDGEGQLVQGDAIVTDQLPEPLSEEPAAEPAAE